MPPKHAKKPSSPRKGARTRQADFTENAREQQVPQQPQSNLQQQQSQPHVPQQLQSNFQQQQSQLHVPQQPQLNHQEQQSQQQQLIMDIDLANQGGSCKRGKRPAPHSPGSEKRTNSKLQKGTEPEIINLSGGIQSTSSASISQIPSSSQPLPTAKFPNTPSNSYNEVGEWLESLRQQVETLKQVQNSEAIQQQLCQLSKTIDQGEPFAKELDSVKQRNIMAYNHLSAAANIIKTPVNGSSAAPITNTKRPNGSYAAVVAPASLTSLPALSLLPPSPPAPRHILNVYPKSTKEGSTSTSQVTKQMLFNEVNIGNLNIGILGVRTLPNKGVAIMCRNAADMDKLSNAIHATPNLTTKASFKRNPSFSFFLNGIHHEKGAILSSIHKKNPSITNGSITICHIRKTANNNSVVFIEANPQGYKELCALEFGLFYDWAKIKLRERITVTQCGHCLKFGHPDKYCSRKQQGISKRCSVCAEAHPITSETCSAQVCCSNCADYNKLLSSRGATKIDTRHRADDLSCPSYVKAQNIAKQQVNYYC